MNISTIQPTSSSVSQIGTGSEPVLSLKDERDQQYENGMTRMFMTNRVPSFLRGTRFALGTALDPSALGRMRPSSHPPG